MYLWPSLQAVMVVAPLDPDRRVPLGPCTATGTFWSAMFSRTMVPAVEGWEDAVQAVTRPTGVLTMVLSTMVMDPTSCLSEPPAEMSMPLPQFWMSRPMYVQPQFHS